MTNKEAIKILKSEQYEFGQEYIEAVDLAIKALEQMEETNPYAENRIMNLEKELEEVKEKMTKVKFVTSEYISSWANAYYCGNDAHIAIPKIELAVMTFCRDHGILVEPKKVKRYIWNGYFCGQHVQTNNRLSIEEAKGLIKQGWTADGSSMVEEEE